MNDSREIDVVSNETVAGPRRVWMPFVWVGGLAALYAGYLMTDAPDDIKNVVGYIAVAVALTGLAIWIWRSSGLRGTGRLVAVALTLVVALFFTPATLFLAQVLPIEAVHNGDVGIIGWRWRGGEADRDLAPAVANVKEVVADDPDWSSAATDYPRFLGTGFWAEAENVKLDRERLAKSSPKEVWRQRIGAGWSGFAVIGRRAITQEQRGDDELVTCYDLDTGELIWAHDDPVRWDPSGAGSLGYEGPRATPTIHKDRVYAQGATGILNSLELHTGKVVWSRDVLKENKAQNVLWGKSNSPLVFDGVVVVSVGGEDGRSWIAYDAETGDELWTSGDALSSYASPVLATLAGVQQILSVDQGLVRAVRADDSKQLWTYDWPSDSGADAAVSQPVPLGEDRVFLSKGYGHGSTVLQIKLDGESWDAKPTWRGGKQGVLPVMKTKMGNVVVHEGYVYGLDEAILQCVDLKTGRKRWKKRRSPKLGHGQILLVDDVILILSEYGEVVLVEASPKRYTELASFEAIEGITWNNPTLAGNLLLVRNALEVACFELPVVEQEVTEPSEPTE
ncbi:MAG: PQQ-binding-like beta-propeller repeat protein [Lacipirellulaceae bacterium]